VRLPKMRSERAEAREPSESARGVKQAGRQVGCHCAWTILRPWEEVNAELCAVWVKVCNRITAAVGFKAHGQN
jgi:hypothetical protein